MATKLQLAIKRRDELQTKVATAFKRYDDAGENDDTSAVESEITATNAELKSAQDEVERLTRLEEMRVAEGDQTKGITRPGAAGGVAAPSGGGANGGGSAEIKRLVSASRVGSLKHLSRLPGLGSGEADEWAYKFARWFLGSVGNMASHAEWVKSIGIEIKAQQESINTAGGFLVPHEFGTRLIDLTEQYGVFRPNAYPEPMKHDTKSIPRRLGGTQFFFTGEGQGGRESEMRGDRVQLVAKKIKAIVLRSDEVDEDALVNWGDMLAGDIAGAAAEKEDLCGFNGDGASEEYGGIVGVRFKLLNMSSNRSHIAGLVVGSGPTWGDLVLGDFSRLKGRLPAYAFRRGTPKWYCSQTFWSEVMEPLALAAGGTTAAEVQRGTDKMFLGYPVETAEVFPQVTAPDDIPVIFGSLLLSSTFGDRRQMTLATSNEYKWAEDMIAIKATERFDINNHDLGNADAVAENRKAGPVVGLATAAEE
ncbi:MAG TPA: phage major capsid protein [Pyrinomonadaceae bacterium]|jgi:HK97 family phage major capsid protein|nr:phage major capsid protein [Pyrinomonadaceae bacterium]